MVTLHTAACQYGNLFAYVPGDTGDPFVALWQATLLNAIVLGGAAMVLLAAARQTQRAAPRYLGLGYLAASAWCGVLALVNVVASTPLYCGGAPGTESPTPAQEQAINVFNTLNILATLTLYLTILLLAVAIPSIIYQLLGRK
jgi:hypothetical protein